MFFSLQYLQNIEEIIIAAQHANHLQFFSLWYCQVLNLCYVVRMYFIHMEHLLTHSHTHTHTRTWPARGSIFTQIAQGQTLSMNGNKKLFLRPGPGVKYWQTSFFPPFTILFNFLEVHCKSRLYSPCLTHTRSSGDKAWQFSLSSFFML